MLMREGGHQYGKVEKGKSIVMISGYNSRFIMASRK